MEKMFCKGQMILLKKSIGLKFIILFKEKK